MAYVSRRYAGWFDGVDDYVKVQGSDEFRLNVFTIELYVRFLNPVADRAVFSLRNNSLQDVYGWCVRTSSSGGELLFSIGDGSSQAVYTTFYPERGKLYHIVYTYDGSKLSLYVDGSFVISANPPQIAYSGTEDIGIGALGDGVAPSKVEILKASIYNRALSDTEIAKLSEDPFDWNNVPKDGLVGAWDFNKADWTNAILPDLSGNGNDGTMYGLVRRDVLVKRGSGELPQYELSWSWVCDGIDDYVIVDFNNWAVTKAMTFNIWEKTYSGSYTGYIVKDYAKGIGYYDSDNDAWRVDSGEVGYFLDEEIVYDETKFGRGIWVYVNNVQVDDNSQSVPLFRVELEDANKGEIIFSHDYTANQFPIGSFSGIVTAGFLFIPYGRYRLRLYSYGNVGFWIRYIFVEGYDGTFLYSYGSSDFRIYRWYTFVHYLIQKTNGSYTFYDGSVGKTMHKFENIVLGWSNLEQKYVHHVNGSYISELSDTAGLDMRGVATQIIFGAVRPDTINNRFTGEMASVMLFDRLLSDTEVSDIYNKKFVLDGLVHWWVVDENGNLVDLVTGKSYQIQGNPYIRRIYDSIGKLNNGTGVIVFDLIKDERGM